MADEGPTTTGSIVGKLRMDRDQWLKDKAETLADARELGSLSPSIHIDDNVPEVLARLEAVKTAAQTSGAVNASSPTALTTGTRSTSDAAKTDSVAVAERRLAAAISASESATARAIVAQMRLEERREKGASSAVQMASAELAASEAIKRSEAAAERAALAENALAEAQQKAARAALEEAAAQELAEKATVKANEANSTSASRIGMIATAVAVLVPMLVPLAAFAVGGAGALTMMGVAGVLAIVGIKNEMANGTTVGNQYAVGIQGLKGDLNELSQTAAVKMLIGFNGSIALINQNMPMLNQNVGIFAGLLGQSGSNLLTGAVNGVRVLAPLLITVGQYLDGLTLKFARWTSDGGLQRFGSYAMSVLPQVEQFLGLLGNAVIKLLQAIAGLGMAGMSAFGLLFQVINALPVQVLADLIAAVTWGVIAFKAWGFVAPLLASIATQLGAVGAAATFATGPIGWIAAGVAALVAVLAVSVTAANSAAAAVDSYTAAVQQDNGVIGENVRLQAAKNLQDAGAIKSAKDLGIATDKLTQAALGNKNAQKTVNDALDKQAESYAQVSTGSATFVARSQGLSAAQRQTKADVENTRTSLSAQEAAVKLAIGSYNELAKAQGLSTISTKAQLAAQQANADAAHVSLSTYLAATASQKDTAAQTEKTTALMYLQGDAAGLLRQKMDQLNGKTLNAAQAQNQFDSQLANMSDHMDASGKQIDRANALLEGNSAAAVKNRGELISLTQAAEDNAQAFRDNGGSAEDTRAKLVAMKQAIIDNAVAHGEDRNQVQQYVDTLFKIPDTIPATKIEVDTANALAEIQRVKDLVASISRSIDIAVNAHGAENLATTGGTKVKFAGGGAVRGAGSKTSDSVDAELSDGEHVWTAEDVDAAGGQDSVYRLRTAIRTGQKVSVGMGVSSPIAPAVAARAAEQRSITNHWHISQADISGAITEIQRRQQGKSA